MSDRKRKSASSADILGPILFIAGVVPALLVVMAIFRGTPGEHATGTGALARGVILAMGHAPVLLLGAGAAGLGVRLFLGGYFESLLRHLSGLAGTAVGLAVLLGCFSMTAGGAIGASTGGFLASMITVVPATIVGLAALAAPIWFTWVRGSEFLPKKISGFDSLSAALGHGDEVAHSEEAGVSAAEADALLPDPVITREQRAISEALEQETAPAWASNDESTQPYPEDPRLKGQIPEGATPLTDPDATEERTTEAAGESAAASSSRWTPRGDTEPEVAPVDDLVVSDEAASGTVEPAVAAPQAEASAELTEAPEQEASAEPQVKVLAETTAIAYEDSAPRPLWETSLAAVEEESTDAGTQAEAEEEDLLESTSSTLWRPAAGAEAADETTAEADTTKDDDGEWEYVEVAGSDTDWNAQEPAAQEATTPAVTAPELTTELSDEDDDTDEQIPEEQEDMLAVEDVDEPLSAEETETEVEEVAEVEEVEEEEVEEVEEVEADVVLIPTAAGAQVVAEEPLVAEEAVETEAEAEEEDDEEWEYVEVAEDEESPVASAETEDDDEEELEDDEEWEYVEVAEGEEGWEEAEEEEEEEEVVAEDEQPPVTSEAAEEDDEEELEDDEEWEYVEVAEGEEGWEDAEEAPELEETEAVAEAQPLAAELEQDADTEEPAETAYEKEFAELLAAEQPEPVVGAAIEAAPELEPELPTAVAEEDVAEAEEVVAQEPAEPVAEVQLEVEAAPEVEEEPAEQTEPEPVAEMQETVEVEAAEPEPEIVAEVQVEAAEEAPAEAVSSETASSEEGDSVEPEAAPQLLDEVQMDLFAEPQAAVEPVAQTDEPAADEAPEPVAATAKADSDEETTDAESAEPVVTLTPQAAGASENAMRAAEVILEAERVAVSMLQRSIGLNFKESCVVLDELQELGFIGPYIDGNRRDILMGREEWLSTVGVE